MSAKNYVIVDEVRQRCAIEPYDDKHKRRLLPVNMELFSYLREVDSIDFPLYLLVEDEVVEYIKPKEFSHELLHHMWLASLVQNINIEVMTLKRDFPKFELVIDQVRDRKIKDLLAADASLDPKVLQVFGNLSGASQMVGRGGITQTVAQRALSATKHLIDNQLDSHVMLGTIARMINHDPTLYDHSAAVAMFGLSIAEFTKRKFTRHELENVALSGLYHDTGKSCVPNQILNKPSHFTPEEYEIMKSHAGSGFDKLTDAINQGASIEPVVAEVAYQHHERFEGGGYPRQRRGRLEDDPNGIHLYARIVTIADVYSALLMKRVYKPAMPSKKALGIMDKIADKEYDPEIYRIFRTNVEKAESVFAAREQELKRSKVSTIEEGESFSQALRRNQRSRGQK